MNHHTTESVERLAQYARDMQHCDDPDLYLDGQTLLDMISQRDAHSYTYIGNDGKPVLARDLEDERDALRERLDEAEAEVLRLKAQVVAYCTVWSVKYARDFGLPDGHLHPTHYDDLAAAGAVMDSFTRAAQEDQS